MFGLPSYRPSRIDRMRRELTKAVDSAYEDVDDAESSLRHYFRKRHEDPRWRAEVRAYVKELRKARKNLAEALSAAQLDDTDLSYAHAAANYPGDWM